MYNYIKALHIIFIVTWFSGMFYIVRLFIYNTEAGERDLVGKEILRDQFSIMIKRLWLGITWPSAILTIIFGTWLVLLLGVIQGWLWIKLMFVVGLLLYHLSLQYVYRQQMKRTFRYTSQQLRIWNEVATLFLVAIVMIVVVKQGISIVWGLVGIIGLALVLMSAIRIYKNIRSRKSL